jgi:hypothetical protein
MALVLSLLIFCGHGERAGISQGLWWGATTGSETANGLLTGINDLTAMVNLTGYQRIRPDSERNALHKRTEALNGAQLQVQLEPMAGAQLSMLVNDSGWLQTSHSQKSKRRFFLLQQRTHSLLLRGRSNLTSLTIFYKRRGTYQPAERLCLVEKVSHCSMFSSIAQSASSAQSSLGVGTCNFFFSFYRNTVLSK